MQQYDLDSLEIIFTEQVKEAEELRKKYLDAFKRNYPDEKIPSFYQEGSFVISQALYSIVKELKQIKEKII